MKLGESVKIAEGTARGFEWKAEVRQYNNGAHPNVVVHAEDGDSVRLSDMGDRLEVEDMAMMAEEIAWALVEALAKAKGFL